MITATEAGTTSVGSSWLDLSSSTKTFVRSLTVPAGLLSEVRAHIRHDVANVPGLAAYLMADHATLTRPGPMIGVSPIRANDWLATATGRWVTFPFGYWFTSSTVVWVAIQLNGSNSIDLAYETTGGDGGDYSNGDAATYTDNSRDMSIYAVVLS